MWTLSSPGLTLCPPRLGATANFPGAQLTRGACGYGHVSRAHTAPAPRPAGEALQVPGATPPLPQGVRGVSER